MNLKNKSPEPFLLSPAGKDYLWGGVRLKESFGKNLPMNPLAETWECSTHPDGPSIVASGVFCGRTLTEVIREHPEYLGTHATKVAKQIGAEGLPILIKFIDANQNLSIQVHPSDDYAFIHEGQPGKTEMWYVLDATPNAKLVYGFYQYTDKATIRAAVQNGSLMKYMNKVSVHKDDVFFISSGIVHAIGEGSLIAEIQENSNVTYRLYDYDRMDKCGKKRALHLEKALEVSDFCAKNELRQPMRVLQYKQGTATELLCRCEYFEVYRMLINNPDIPYDLIVGGLSFKVLLCIDGIGKVVYGKKRIILKKGSCVFLPASEASVEILGCVQLLIVNS